MQRMQDGKYDEMIKKLNENIQELEKENTKLKVDMMECRNNDKRLNEAISSMDVKLCTKEKALEEVKAKALEKNEEMRFLNTKAEEEAKSTRDVQFKIKQLKSMLKSKNFQ